MRVLIIGWVSAAILFLFGVTFTYLTFRSAQGAVTLGAQSGAVPYSIVVGADGMASASPDVGYVALGVDTPARTAEEATAANSQAMTTVIQAIKGQGVPDKDIRTTEFSVTPVYASQRPGDSSPPAINGYRVRNSVRVTVENVQDVGRVLDAALQGRANSGVGVSFGLKDSTSVEQQALKDAFQQAKSKAEAIAASAGLKLTGAYSISESSVQPPRPLGVAAAQPAAANATPIETGELTTNAHLQVTFQYAH